MSDALTQLLEAAKKIQMTETQEEEQRQSFAYGNANIENELVTRETIAHQADILKKKAHD